MTNLHEIVAFIRSQACGGDNFNKAVLYVAEMVERHCAGKTVDSEDAARYRWLRAERSVIDAAGLEHDVFDEDGSLLFYEHLDAAVDAARGITKQEPQS